MTVLIELAQKGPCNLTPCQRQDYHIKKYCINFIDEKIGP